MARPRLVRVGIAAVGGIVLLASAVAPHPFDTEEREPRSYGDAIHLLRDQIQGINRAREYRSPEAFARRASRLAALAGTVPGFALVLPGALRDSAAGPILRASARLGAVAAALDAAGDSLATTRQVEQCAALVAMLDGFAPSHFVCPMRCEPGKTYDRAGFCPVCRMHLQRITDERYTVDVRPVGGSVRARVPVSIQFEIRDPAGFEVRHLQVVHEKLLHLMIVSQDLARFDHVHPTLEADGRFSLRHVFPEGGRYFLFNDFTPDSMGMQVVPVEVVVEGPEPDPRALVVDADQPKRIEGYEVTLSHSPLVPDAACTMTFTLSRGGKPVTDLEPFLGAAGHLVVISQDHAAYIHSHPLETERVSGPSVEFRLRFERTGIYRAWGQFQRKGRVLTFPFTFEVTTAATAGPLREIANTR